MTTKRSKPSVKAAGGVLYRLDDKGRARFLAVHRPRYDDWSLPKGKLDRGEAFLEAAVREVREETGYRGRRPRAIGSIGYETTAENRKVVRWWLMDAGKGKFRPNREVDAIAWLTPKKAGKRLRYRNDRNVVDRAQALVEDHTAATLYLVRHVSARERSSWDGPERRRPIDDRGAKQARTLARWLRSRPVTRVLTSDYRRCVQTARPVSLSVRVKSEHDKRLRRSARPSDLLGLIKQLRGEAAVLSTHREVVEPLIRKLAKSGVDLAGSPLAWEKGSVWVLQARNGKVRSGRYVSLRR